MLRSQEICRGKKADYSGKWNPKAERRQKVPEERKVPNQEEGRL